MIFRRSTGKQLDQQLMLEMEEGTKDGSILSYAGKCVKY